MLKTDVIIIGAGAAGLMCAIEAGKRGRQVTILDHANKPGKKILMSGGGRCNFTNLNIEAENFISANPHFCKSAISRYTQWHFIDMVQKHNIAYHEREHGQLFCDTSSKEILSMLLAEASKAKVNIHLNTTVTEISSNETGYQLKIDKNICVCESLVIATGGLSIPKMGATSFGHKIAAQFNINVIKTSAALVPVTLQPDDKQRFKTLSGIAVNSSVQLDNIQFKENILFTHRGLSGPAILQISSYWDPSKNITINLLPEMDLNSVISNAIESHPQQILKTILNQYFPKRLINVFINKNILETKLIALTKKDIEKVVNQLQRWTIKPSGTEGYRTAEVTRGGIDCKQLSSKTMQATNHPGLYFIGEVVDVTGWLGGYNFQWAWSSGWCAGQYV